MSAQNPLNNDKKALIEHPTVHYAFCLLLRNDVGQSHFFLSSEQIGTHHLRKSLSPKAVKCIGRVGPLEASFVLSRQKRKSRKRPAWFSLTATLTSPDASLTINLASVSIATKKSVFRASSSPLCVMSGGECFPTIDMCLSGGHF